MCPNCFSKLTYDQGHCIICGQNIVWDNWHNLNTTPNDLPTVEDVELFEIVLQHKYSGYIEYSHGKYLHISDGNFWLDDIHGWINHPTYTSGSGGDSFFNVIAWRKVKPYNKKNVFERNTFIFTYPSEKGDELG